jgi:hypothetical protein
MAAEGIPEEKLGGEAPAAAPAPVIKIEQPLEAKEFDQFLGIFMSKAGISDRRKAAVLAARALRNIGLDPTSHLDEAVKSTQFLTSVLQILPDAGEVTRATKDVIAAQGISQIGEKILQAPTTDERTAQLMERMIPYKIMMDMFRSGGDMGGAGTKSAELAAIEAKLASVEEKLKEKPIEELKGAVQGLRDEIKELKAGGLKPREEGESKVEKLLGELKAAYSEGKGKSEIGDKLDNLTKALTEREHASELDGIKQAVDGVKADVASKIAGLESSMGKGAPQQDQLKQAGDLFTNLGDLYKGAGEMAKSLGFEPKGDKMSGDLKRDVISLGKKALDVFEKGFKSREKPERRQVQQLQQPIQQPVIIPVEQAQPVTPQEVPAEAPPEAPTVAPFAKRPKPPEAEAPEAPPQAEPTEALPESPPQEAPPAESSPSSKMRTRGLIP